MTSIPRWMEQNNSSSLLIYSPNGILCVMCVFMYLVRYRDELIYKAIQEVDWGSNYIYTEMSEYLRVRGYRDELLYLIQERGVHPNVIYNHRHIDIFDIVKKDIIVTCYNAAEWRHTYPDRLDDIEKKYNGEIYPLPYITIHVERWFAMGAKIHDAPADTITYFTKIYEHDRDVAFDTLRHIYWGDSYDYMMIFKFLVEHEDEDMCLYLIDNYHIEYDLAAEMIDEIPLPRLFMRLKEHIRVNSYNIQHLLINYPQHSTYIRSQPMEHLV